MGQGKSKSWVRKGVEYTLVGPLLLSFAACLLIGAVAVPLILVYGFAVEPVYIRLVVGRNRRLSRKAGLELAQSGRGTFILDNGPMLGRLWWTSEAVEYESIDFEKKLGVFEAWRIGHRVHELAERYLNPKKSEALFVDVWNAGRFVKQIERTAAGVRVVLLDTWIANEDSSELVCPKCEYDLRGLEEVGVCPECGENLAGEDSTAESSDV